MRHKKTKHFLILLLITFPIQLFAQSQVNHDPKVLSAITGLGGKNSSKMNIVWHKGEDRIKTLSGKLSDPLPGSPDAVASRFLRENGKIFRLEQALSDLNVENTKDIGAGEKLVKFRQVIGTLEVFDGGLEVT